VCKGFPLAHSADYVPLVSYSFSFLFPVSTTEKTTRNLGVTGIHHLFRPILEGVEKGDGRKEGGGQGLKDGGEYRAKANAVCLDPLDLEGTRPACVKIYL
jgi:hypothetical protein